MSYFDSEKNKAIWSKRLAVLEQERDRRKAEGYKPTQRREVQEAPAKAGTRVISFEELVAKETARHQVKREAAAGRHRTRQAAPAREAADARTR